MPDGDFFEGFDFGFEFDWFCFKFLMSVAVDCVFEGFQAFYDMLDFLFKRLRSFAKCKRLSRYSRAYVCGNQVCHKFLPDISQIDPVYVGDGECFLFWNEPPEPTSRLLNGFGGLFLGIFRAREAPTRPLCH